MELKLERRGEEDRTVSIPVQGSDATAVLTPSIDEDYWAYRVMVSEKQAVVGFPKFFTIGIGFAVEEDWNTNLPYTCKTDEIYKHIQHNRTAAGDEPDWKDCIRAIDMIQKAALSDEMDVSRDD